MNNPFRVLLVVALAAASLWSGRASADTYKCDAVDDLARLGYDGSQKVAIVGEGKVCKFSIGGASSDGLSPPRNFDDALKDQQLLSSDPDEFVADRLATVILEAAASLGEPAAFVMERISGDMALSDLSCFDERTVALANLEVRCIVLTDANRNGPQGFENGIITAVLFRPMFIFEIRAETGAAAMVIFIPPAR
jgi:hypothetical protein